MIWKIIVVRVSSSSQRYHDYCLLYWDDGSLFIFVSFRHCHIKKIVVCYIVMILHVGLCQNNTSHCKQDGYVLFLFSMNKDYRYCIVLRMYTGVIVWNILTLIIIRWFQGDGVVIVGVQLMWICKTGGKRYVFIWFTLISIWIINIYTSTYIIVSIGSKYISIEKRKHVLIPVLLLFLELGLGLYYNDH